MTHAAQSETCHAQRDDDLGQRRPSPAQHERPEQNHEQREETVRLQTAVRSGRQEFLGGAEHGIGEMADDIVVKLPAIGIDHGRRSSERERRAEGTSWLSRRHRARVENSDQYQSEWKGRMQVGPNEHQRRGRTDESASAEPAAPMRIEDA